MHARRRSRLALLLPAVIACAAAATWAAEPAPTTSPGSPAYAAWENGPPSDPSYFPIAVWVQQPHNAARYKAAGINLYVGLWDGPTQEQLAELTRAGMPVICSQNELALAHRDDPIIIGWMHDDEPDNAQPVVDPATGERGWGTSVPTDRVVERYERMRRADPTRPVFLNLGQGVANDEWIGRGPGATLEDYPRYLKGCDIASFDVYPVSDLRRPDGQEFLWYVAKGIDRLGEWTGRTKPLWTCIETTRIHGDRRPTPQQVRAEVWMALIHGARGLVYFVHEWNPRFVEHRLLEDPEMLVAVTAINAEVRSLAAVLNAGGPIAGAKTTSSTPDVPVDALIVSHGGGTYILAVGMRNAQTRASFTVPGLAAGRAIEVIGEGRTVTSGDAGFSDDFAPYAVHLYRTAGGDPKP